MARVAPLESAPEENVRQIFSEIEEAFGKVPNLFRTYAHFPPLLAANWNKVKALMMAGSLRREVKEAIAVLVSQDNGCRYCVAAHETALRAIGVSADEIRRIEESLEQSAFDAKEKALIEMARGANRAPQQMADETFQVARDLGASSAEIVEALGVMEIFTAFSRFLDALQVAIDFPRGLEENG